VEFFHNRTTHIIEALREKMSEFLSFPKDFVWGTATAAYQVEGAVHEDGRKDSIWDVFAHTPGKIANSETGDVADDHYHRVAEDVRWMHDLGCQAYRFSLAWPRILPDGKGKINQPGIDFYNRLIDALLAENIRPMITLYHWDLPIALQGGWLSRDTAYAFEEFTSVAARAFGDRVKDWVTLNEPWCSSFLSYKIGIHAPGMHDTRQAVLASHYLLLAHGLSVPVLRQECADARVGIALNQGPFYPATSSEEDRDGARKGDGDLNRWFIDPLFGRHYPADMLLDYVKEGVLFSMEPEFIQPGDMQKISAPLDFLGLNYYSRTVVQTGSSQKDGDPLEATTFSNNEKTDLGWEIFPHGLYETLCRMYFNYRPKEIIVTENGADYRDGPDETGQVHDPRRIAYLRSHLASVHKAIKAGVPLGGYYLWSLLDNFEWSNGYAPRFGLLHVDYSTLKRTPKDSAYWYSQVIRENGLKSD
jgi:beta-glucosidase